MLQGIVVKVLQKYFMKYKWKLYPSATSPVICEVQEKKTLFYPPIKTHLLFFSAKITCI